MERLKDLNKLFRDSDLTLADVSKESGVSVSTVHRYVRGTVKEVKDYYYDRIYNTIINMTQSHLDNVNTAIDVSQLKEQMMSNALSKNNNVGVTTIAPIKTDACNINTSTGSTYSINNSESNTHTTTATTLPKRGEIWFVKGTNSTVGKEMWSGSKNRPCVVVQNTKMGNTNTILIVYMTKQPKEFENPAFVTIQTNTTSTVICNQINALGKERFVNKAGEVSEIDMNLIERAMLTALDIKINPKSDLHHLPDYLKLQVENKMLRETYRDLINVLSK